VDMKNRPSWDEYFMEIAEVVAKRSTCLRRAVGAIAIKDKRILATGYNGQISGAKHCQTCLRTELNVPSGERQELCRVIHAEQNIVSQAATYGVSLVGSTVYCTNKTCSMCFRLLANTQVVKIIYKDGYPDKIIDMLMEEAGFIESKKGKYFEIEKVSNEQKIF